MRPFPSTRPSGRDPTIIRSTRRTGGSPSEQCSEFLRLFSVPSTTPYFSVTLSSPRPELVVKKLRYYARYIVVCLLLNKMDLVKMLVKVRGGAQ